LRLEAGAGAGAGRLRQVWYGLVWVRRRVGVRLQAGEKKASLRVCSVGAEEFGDALGGQAGEGNSCLQQVGSGSTGGVSGRAGRAEASAADDLLEFSVGRLPWTCHAIWRLFICLLDELGLLRTSSSAGKLPRTIGRVA